MNVKVVYTRTVNTGNYESLKIGCALEDSAESFENREETQKKLYKRARKFVLSEIKKETEE